MSFFSFPRADLVKFYLISQCSQFLKENKDEQFSAFLDKNLKKLKLAQ